MMMRMRIFIALSKELFDRCDNVCKVGLLWWNCLFLTITKSENKLFLTITNNFVDVIDEDDKGKGKRDWRTWIGILCKNNNRGSSPRNRQGLIWCHRLNWGFWWWRKKETFSRGLILIWRDFTWEGMWSVSLLVAFFDKDSGNPGSGIMVRCH